MVAKFFRNLFGSRNDREIKRYSKIVTQVNAFEGAAQELTDQEIQDKTEYFRQQLQDGKTLEEMIPEVFATVREASRRVMGMRHFDVQLIGAMVLNWKTVRLLIAKRANLPSRKGAIIPLSESR